MRLQIKPGLRQVWRGPSAVQIGLDTRHGVVLDGLTEPDREVVRQLATGLDDGAADVPAPDDPATGPGHGPRTRQLLRMLAEADVLVSYRAGRAALTRLGAARHRLADDAQVWSVVRREAGDGWDLLAARTARRVEIHGGGRLGTTLAATLAAAGVGSVRVRDTAPTRPRDLAPTGPFPDDLGGSRERAAHAAVSRVTGSGPAARATSRPPDEGPSADRPAGHRPDLVVLIDHGVADAPRADPLLAADIPYLSLVAGEASVVVGPLVVPGHGPCLRCLDLHRTDHDPVWPRLLTQVLSGPLRHAHPGTVGAQETASAGLAASLAALQVLGHLDGPHRDRQGSDERGSGVPSPDGPAGDPRDRPSDDTPAGVPAALGATLEVLLPDGLVMRHPWPVHPECGCIRLPTPQDPDRHADPSPGPGPRAQARAGRMPP